MWCVGSEEKPLRHATWKGSNTLEVKLSHWPKKKICATVEYGDVSNNEAKRVFTALKSYPMENEYIAVPVCYTDTFIAYEDSSKLTLDILRENDFPLDSTYYTLRCIITSMLDLHEVGIGGLPHRVSQFVRTENTSGICKLYHASILKRNCHEKVWEDVVKLDYRRMENFVKELMENHENSMELKKSEALFRHFLGVLQQHKNKSFKNKEGERFFILQHPLMMNYVQIKKFLKLAGWKRSQPNKDHDAVVEALRTIPDYDWRAEVRKLPRQDRYMRCLKGRRRDIEYEGSYYVEYCRDMMTHPKIYNLHEVDFSWPEMFRQFEVFYPAYLGFLWIALGKHGLCSDFL